MPLFCVKPLCLLFLHEVYVYLINKKYVVRVRRLFIDSGIGVERNMSSVLYEVIDRIEWRIL